MGLYPSKQSRINTRNALKQELYHPVGNGEDLAQPTGQGILATLSSWIAYIFKIIKNYQMKALHMSSSCIGFWNWCNIIWTPAFAWHIISCTMKIQNVT